jgi:hypothetical protein
VSISVNIHPKSFEAQRSEQGNTWLNIEAGGGTWATVHVNTAEKADELIRAAVELKRLVLGDASDVGPAMAQDLTAAESDPANPYGGQAKHGESTAPSAAAVAEGLAPPPEVMAEFRKVTGAAGMAEGEPPFHVTGTGVPGCGARHNDGYACTAQRDHGGPDHIAYMSEGADNVTWPQEPASPLTPPAPHLPQHKGSHPECTASGCGEPGHHLHAIEVPTRGEL